LLTLVIPVYRNESSIQALLQAVDRLQAGLDNALEAVFVVDGSPDHSYELLRDRLPAHGFRSQLLLLSRNFGSFAAIRAGLQAGTGTAFAVMAADLQEPPELILDFARILAADEADVTVGVREGREDPLASRAMSGLFWSLYRRHVVREMPPGGVDIFGCNRAFRDQLLAMEERHSSLVAQVFWLGFRRKFVPYRRQERTHGHSAWTFSKKLNYMMDSVFAFTDLPIRLLIRGGGLVAALSGLFAAMVVMARLNGWIEVPGYTLTILAIVFFGALNLFALGVVGSYAWRAYENTKQRPLHVVLRRHVWDRNGASA
jgi:glycosyltransferase involved in cell wall biosynthesis